jgi:hypothetical protein
MGILTGLLGGDYEVAEVFVTPEDFKICFLQVIFREWHIATCTVGQLI